MNWTHENKAQLAIDVGLLSQKITSRTQFAYRYALFFLLLVGFHRLVLAGLSIVSESGPLHDLLYECARVSYFLVGPLFELFGRL
ncbi:TPA: hypothetical protein I7730_14080 [Vibrio vulnificus]|uniref:Uncharacterized protein n=1 Tax=Vibrio vulnificus TaxID=672 RepID=A0A8H9N161_VIBVL|nr:hypothetical protein [Vibrio vulnificus]